jgi:hypothetical protein
MTTSHSEPSFSDMEGRDFSDLAEPRRPLWPMRTSLTEVCTICGGVGHWSGFYVDAVFQPPTGHRREFIQNGSKPIIFDSCNKNRAA